jgi:hypothetical protein
VKKPYFQQTNGNTARVITRSLSNSDIDKTVTLSQGEK